VAPVVQYCSSPALQLSQVQQLSTMQPTPAKSPATKRVTSLPTAVTRPTNRGPAPSETPAPPIAAYHVNIAVAHHRNRARRSPHRRAATRVVRPPSAGSGRSRVARPSARRRQLRRSISRPPVSVRSANFSGKNVSVTRVSWAKAGRVAGNAHRSAITKARVRPAAASSETTQAAVGRVTDGIFHIAKAA